MLSDRRWAADGDFITRARVLQGQAEAPWPWRVICLGGSSNGSLGRASPPSCHSRHSALSACASGSCHSLITANSSSLSASKADFSNWVGAEEV